MIWQKFFRMICHWLYFIIMNFIFLTKSITKWKSFAKKEEIWVMIELNDAPAPHLLLWDACSLWQRNKLGSWLTVLPTPGTFTGYFYSWLTWPGIQGISRARIPATARSECLQDFKNVRHSVIIVSWCLDPAGHPAPALSLSTPVCLSLSLSLSL